MRVLLTGVTSCIGKYTLRQLEDNPIIEELVTTSRKAEHYYGYFPAEQRIKHVECHLDSTLWVNRLLSEFKPTHVIHIAGNGSQQAASRETYMDNLLTTANLLDNVPEGCDFTLLSSIVCDKPAKNAYTLAKHEAERLLKLYHEQDHVYGKVIRTCAIVGNGAKRGLLPDLARKLRSADDTLNLIGKEPGSIKPFVYAEELAQFIVSNLNIVTTGFYIEGFGPRDYLSVKNVADISQGELGIYKHIEWNGIDSPQDQQIVKMPAGTILSNSHSSEAIKLALRDIMKGVYGGK